MWGPARFRAYGPHDRAPRARWFGKHIDSDNHVFLAHRRLSIVDLEQGGQPMWNRDHTIAVVFNGEIYNHLELREELVETVIDFRLIIAIRKF